MTNENFNLISKCMGNFIPEFLLFCYGMYHNFFNVLTQCSGENRLNTFLTHSILC